MGNCTLRMAIVQETPVLEQDAILCSVGDLGKWELHQALTGLHKPNTFFSFPAGGLLRYPRLNELTFGFTLSTQSKYAVIPIPSAESMGIQTPRLSNIGELLRFFLNYEAAHGPLRTIIASGEKYVDELTREFKELLKDSRINRLK